MAYLCTLNRPLPLSRSSTVASLCLILTGSIPMLSPDVSFICTSVEHHGFSHVPTR